jgi:hypothetical protein
VDRRPVEARTFGLVLVITLRPQTLKHIRGGWSHDTDTSEPVDGNGDLSITGPTRLPPALRGEDGMKGVR